MSFRLEIAVGGRNGEIFRKKHTDLFAANAAHSDKKANGVSHEQIRVLNKNSNVDLSTCVRGDTVVSDTSEWEKKIDMLVYDLYGLTAEEIAIIDNNENA